MKIVAVIPARGGSKGIPQKNLHKVAGKPLIAWTIESAMASKLIDTIVVSSDNEEILDFSKTYNTITNIKRPLELATDSAPTEPVLRHALDELKLYEKYEYLILLQPTSPLRDSNDIDDAITTLLASEATSLISVTQPDHHPLKSFVKDDEGYLKGLVNNQFPFMPRQELPETYQPNGAIYIVEVKEFLKNNKLFTNRTIAYNMSSEKSIDVDSLEDVIKIENQLKT
ncbi:MAG: acylneuraminate cytidylyltransferase family protein [Flavobacteriaceae bacterium]